MIENDVETFGKFNCTKIIFDADEIDTYDLIALQNRVVTLSKYYVKVIDTDINISKFQLCNSVLRQHYYVDNVASWTSK